MALILLLSLFAEIALLIKFGQFIGGGWLLLEILASAALGYWFIRRAGRRFLRTDELIGVMANPAEYMRRSGWPLILAGILLIVPGILGDLLGLWLFARARFGAPQGDPSSGDAPPSSTTSSSDPDTIDIEYSVHEDSEER